MIRKVLFYYQKSCLLSFLTKKLLPLLYIKENLCKKIKSLGNIEFVDLRDCWEYEDKDFTPWLTQDDNIKSLGDAIDLDLEVESQEVNVGPFSLKKVVFLSRGHVVGNTHLNFYLLPLILPSADLLSAICKPSFIALLDGSGSSTERQR